MAKLTNKLEQATETIKSGLMNINPDKRDNARAITFLKQGLSLLNEIADEEE